MCYWQRHAHKAVLGVAALWLAKDRFMGMTLPIAHGARQISEAILENPRTYQQPAREAESGPRRGALAMQAFQKHAPSLETALKAVTSNERHMSGAGRGSLSTRLEKVNLLTVNQGA